MLRHDHGDVSEVPARDRQGVLSDCLRNRLHTLFITPVQEGAQAPQVTARKANLFAYLKPGHDLATRSAHNGGLLGVDAEALTADKPNNVTMPGFNLSR